MIDTFKIEAYKYSVRETLDSKIVKVNEPTFRNLQLQVALGKLVRFWFLNIKKEWQQCKEDGYLPSSPYAKGFTPDAHSMFGSDSALGQNDELAIKLHVCQRRQPKTMDLPKVRTPYFYVDGQAINEYELRTLMCEVREGKRGNCEIPVRDEKGNVTEIRTDGILRGTPSGINLSGELAMKLLRTDPVFPIK
jgi:hypothetical protein